MAASTGQYILPRITLGWLLMAGPLCLAFLNPQPSTGQGRASTSTRRAFLPPAAPAPSFLRQLGIVRASTIEKPGEGVLVDDGKPDRNKARESFSSWISANLKLSSDVAGEVFDIGTVTRGRLGELLILEGPEQANKDRELFFLLQGQARVEVRGSRVATLKEGDFIGEASFVSGRRGPRSVTVICAGERGVDYIVWDQKLLKRYMDKRPAVSQAFNTYFIKQLSNKLLSTMRTYERTAEPEEVKAEELKYGADFGFRNDSSVQTSGPSDSLSKATPAAAIDLARWNFGREYSAIRRGVRFNDKTRLRKSIGNEYGGASVLDFGGILSRSFFGILGLIDLGLEKVGLLPELKLTKSDVTSDPKILELQGKLQELSLSNEAITQREVTRREIQQDIVKQGMSSGISFAAKLQQAETPWFILVPYYALCYLLDVVFDGRPIQRFWLLETVARMPYFSYISMLHLYETLGWWSIGADIRKIHFSEEWNEMHHLRIMESLGGDTRWGDRFLARHAAVVYYWLLNLLFVFSPRLAYSFSALIESHAVDTYGQFLDENEELLKSLPAPYVAIEYYCLGDLYLFDEFQNRAAYSRRPVIRSLYDVFQNIMVDESEHVKTVTACQTTDKLIISPNSAAANAGWAEPVDKDEVEASEREIEEDWLIDFDPFSSGGRFEGGPPDAGQW